MDNMDVLNRAWDVIADVRDAHPRVPNDADTYDIVNALNAAGLLVAKLPGDDER